MAKSSIKTKIFIGYEMPVDLKFQLNHSKTWKIATVGNELIEENIIEQPFDGKNYIGFVFDSEMISLKSINDKGGQLVELLQKHSSEIDWSKREVRIFSQVFIT